MIKPRLLVGIVTAILLTMSVSVGACAPQPSPAPLPVPTPSSVPTPAPSPSPTPTSAPQPKPVPSSLPAPTTAPTLIGTLKVFVTDAPPSDDVTSIIVKVTEVQVHKALTERQQEQEKQQVATGNLTREQERQREQQQTAQGEGEWISISMSDNTSEFDLLKIKGIEQFLGTNTVAAGKYTQVRLVVDTIKVGLGGGLPREAKLPSKELKLVQPFDVVAGETTALVLDFDADKMVNITGADNIMVKPVVKLTVRQEKPAVQKDEEKTNKETPGQATIQVSYDEFMSAKNVNRQLEVKVGDSFKVILGSNPTTGFRWSELAQISNKTIVDQMAHELITPKGKPAAGAAGQEVWTFRALKAGTTAVSMEYSRPWQGGEKGEWTFKLTVIVK